MKTLQKLLMLTALPLFLIACNKDDDDAPIVRLEYFGKVIKQTDGTGIADLPMDFMYLISGCGGPLGVMQTKTNSEGNFLIEFDYDRDSVQSMVDIYQVDTANHKQFISQVHEWWYTVQAKQGDKELPSFGSKLNFSEEIVLEVVPASYLNLEFQDTSAMDVYNTLDLDIQAVAPNEDQYFNGIGIVDGQNEDGWNLKVPDGLTYHLRWVVYHGTSFDQLEQVGEYEATVEVNGAGATFLMEY